MRSLLVSLIIFGSLPVILLKPHIGVLMWSWISYMNPHRLTFGFAYDFPFAMVVAIVVIVAILFSREPKRLPLNWVTGLLILLTLWTCLTTLTTLVPEVSSRQWEKVMKVLFMTYLSFVLINTRERLHALVWVIVLSVGFFGFKGGLWTLLGNEGRIYGPAGSFIADNNDMALALIMTMPLVRYLQLNSAVRYVRWFLLFFMLCVMVAILASYSRGAFLGLGVTLFVLALKSRRRLVVFGLGAVVVTVGLSMMPSAWFERMATIESYEDDPSALGRLDAWQFAINVAKDRPFVGGGFRVFGHQEIFDRYMPAGTTARAAHSIYFEVLGDHGFAGLFIFLLLGLATLRCGTWIIKRTKHHADLKWAYDLASMTQVGVIGYAATGMFLSRAFFDLYFHLIVILVMTRVVVTKVLAEKGIRTQSQFSPMKSLGGPLAQPARI